MSPLEWLGFIIAWLIGVRILGMIAEGVLYIVQGGSRDDDKC